MKRLNEPTAPLMCFFAQDFLTGFRVKSYVDEEET